MRSVTLRKVERDSLDDDGFVEGTPAMRIGMMWEMVRWASAIDKTLGDVDLPLQRNVTRIIRKTTAPENYQ